MVAVFLFRDRHSIRFLSVVLLIQCKIPTPTIASINCVHSTVHGFDERKATAMSFFLYRYSFVVNHVHIHAIHTAICRFRFVVVAASFLSLFSSSSFRLNSVALKACNCVFVRLSRVFSMYKYNLMKFDRWKLANVRNSNRHTHVHSALNLDFFILLFLLFVCSFWFSIWMIRFVRFGRLPHWITPF